MRKDLVLVALLISMLGLMVIPLPQELIDVLLTVNISLSIMLLMVAVYLKKPTDFSTLPAVILIGTVFRLSLSIATTRLILAEADAGQIIATFGEFVIAGSVVIGLVIFLVITVVQFVVITKGAERVAEVAARFTLDAMPGKQMSIEADIRAGTIDQETGGKRRRALAKESQFFGAMDGAMKFVKGDAIAGLIIIFINLIGGMVVGTSVHGLTLAEAAHTYSLLTIGDGLVAQIPALLMALCAGAIVTRVTNDGAKDLGTDIAKELMADARVPAVAAVVIFAFGFVPGFPTMIFTGAAAALFIGSIAVRRALKALNVAAEQKAEAEKSQDTGEESKLPTSKRIGLYLSADAAKGLDTDLIKSEIAHRIAFLSARYGVQFACPFVEMSGSIGGGASYTIELDEVALEAGKIPAAQALTAASADQLRALGIEREETAVDWLIDHIPHRYVPIKAAAKLKAANIASVGMEVALAERVFRKTETKTRVLFAGDEYAALISAAKSIDAATLELITEKKSAQDLLRVFRYLLEDGVPLRPLRLLIESLGQWINLQPDADPVFLAECLRQSLKRQLCQNLAGSDGELGVSMLSPLLQDRLIGDLARLKQVTNDIEVDGLPLEPRLIDLLVDEVRALFDAELEPGKRIAIVAAPEIRRRLRNTLANVGLNVPVIAPHEISQDVVTFPLAVLGERLVGESRQDLPKPAVSKPTLRNEGRLAAARRVGFAAE
jgi:type III secretion protein V